MRVLIGLGGNVGDVPTAFGKAVRWLSDEEELLAPSRLYRSEPVGPRQPRFWNMAVLLRVERSPKAMLELCQQIEAEAGRDRRREQRWGPRTLDLDLLISPQVVFCSPRLQLPHPRLHERAFALVPAAELCPDWVHPVLGRTLAELAAKAFAAAPEAVQVVGVL